MITLITGAPGSGKSAALVSLLLELSKTRTIYAHGIPDLKIDHQPLDAPDKWHETVPDGCIIVIDEVQTIWRPRGPGQGVPPDIQALETHRHRGLDFYIITQSPRLVHTNVRALVGRHVHLRDVGFLGRWWYEWPECSENCTASFKTAPIKKKYKLPKAIFGQYKSATEHIKPVRSFPSMLVVAVLALIATAALAWYSASNIFKLGAPNPEIKPYTPMTKPRDTGAQPAQTHNAASQESRPYHPKDWIPVVASVPHSAPAYDAIRQVTTMPKITGGICNSKKCVCVTQQGTAVDMPEKDCRDWLGNRPFDPYQLAGPQDQFPQQQYQQPGQQVAQRHQSPQDGSPQAVSSPYPRILSPVGRPGYAHSPS